MYLNSSDLSPKLDANHGFDEYPTRVTRNSHAYRLQSPLPCNKFPALKPQGIISRQSLDLSLV